MTGIWLWGVKSNKVIPHPGTLLSPSAAHPLQIEICKKKKIKKNPPPASLPSPIPRAAFARLHN